MTVIVVSIWYTHHEWDMYSDACQGYNISAILSGVSGTDPTNFYGLIPIVGIATVALAYGNYSMHLLYHNETPPAIFRFEVFQSFNYTPALESITYNESHAIYFINDTANPYNISPTLGFPSLDLISNGSSSGFQYDSSCSAPSVQLDYHNNSFSVYNVLKTAMTSPSNCSQLKVCGMLDGTDDFQIALGVVMIAQSSYSYGCQTCKHASDD